MEDRIHQLEVIVAEQTRRISLLEGYYMNVINGSFYEVDAEDPDEWDLVAIAKIASKKNRSYMSLEDCCFRLGVGLDELRSKEN